MLPLNGNRKIPNPTDVGNAGLYFSKFVNVWPDIASKKLGEFKGLQGGEKTEWIKKFCKSVGNLDELQASATRMDDLSSALAKDSDAIRPTCYVNDSMFVTGMGLSHPVENGFLWHPTLGVPYLPGSSIKGMVRAWVQHWLGKHDVADRLFGYSDGGSAGSIIVFDALPVAPVRLDREVLTPHDGGWRTKENTAPSDWISPNPIFYLVVAPGSQFNFVLAARKCAQKDDLKLAYEYLDEALQLIGAGAKTSVGFGRFEAVEVVRKRQRERNRIQREIQDNRAFKVGEEVDCPLGRGFVVDVDGDRASIDFRDGDSPESVSMKELKRV